MAKPPILSIDDLRGGINNSDSPTKLAANEIVDARNVDFREGVLGTKRRGTEGIDLSGSVFDSPVIALIRHTPSNETSDDELWGIDENGNVDRRVGGSWAGGVAAVNDHVVVNSRNYDANGVSLHGKLFLAAQGTQDRLLVWDGTVLRWAGLQQPPDPTVADSAAAGSYSGTRYFRIRYVERNANDVVIRRSEFTNVVSLAPLGTKTGAVITKPAGTEATTSAFCEGQTDWEVEASIDNILFYRIATVDIATSTYTDTTAFSTGYSSNPLSEQAGEYVVPGSARHVAVDEDRVVMAGNFFEESLDSTVFWTPVNADDGVGNDERVPTATRQFIAFDGLDGGRVTALVAGVAGNVYPFKLSRVYKMVRTGIASAAYDPIAESYARGSVMRGAASGTDQNGVPCVYFLDPSVGLCRVGKNGVEDLAQRIRDTWRRRNLSPLIGPRILYYPGLDQVWYTSPTGDAETVLSANGNPILSATSDPIETSQTAPNLMVEFEVRYGATMFHDGLLGAAQSLGLFEMEGAGLVPVIGTEEVSIGGGNDSSIHFADTGTTDSGTNFRAYVRTKPYTLGNLWTKFGLMAGAVLARAQAGTTLWIELIRNFGKETVEKTTSLAPTASEEHVIAPLDMAYLSGLNAVQLEFGDEAASAQEWSIDQIVFKVREEEGTAG